MTLNIIPKKITTQKPTQMGNSNSLGDVIFNHSMKKVAFGWLKILSGSESTPINGNTADMLKASIKEETIISPSNRTKAIFLGRFRFLQTLLK
jgi:hypothetical protein